MSQRNRLHRLFLDHAQALQVFFRRRVRHLRDPRDLTQEVYLRLLRAGENRPIFNPEAYLFTVASNLVKERHAMQRRESQCMEAVDPLALDVMNVQVEQPDVSGQLDHAVQQRYLRTLMPELAPRTRLVLMLTFEEELSHAQIAQRIGVSKTMVRKILAQAVGHCRKRMIELEAL